MAARILDELKAIKQEIDESAIYKAIADFFDDMDIDEEDKERRIETCSELQRALLHIFMLAMAGELTEEECIDRFGNDYMNIISKHKYLGIYKNQYNHFKDLIHRTFEKMDEPYYTSVERSIAIAEMETNAVANYDSLIEAYENGYTTKTWVSVKDKKVRKSHEEMDGVTVGILDTFKVGLVTLLHPCDIASAEEQGVDGARETCNCRCTLVYA